MPEPPALGVLTALNGDSWICGEYVLQLALALFVTWITADNHDASVTTDYATVVTNFLNAGFYLHEASFTGSLSSYLQGPASRYFGADLLIAINDTAAGQVVGCKFHDDAILRKDTNVVLSHLA